MSKFNDSFAHIMTFFFFTKFSCCVKVGSVKLGLRSSESNGQCFIPNCS